MVCPEFLTSQFRYRQGVCSTRLAVYSYLMELVEKLKMHVHKPLGMAFVLSAGVLTLTGGLSLGAEQCALSKLKPNPDAPPRSATGRIDGTEFFKRYPNHELVIVPCDLAPNDDFGTARPGEKFGGDWLVAAKGEKVGLNHKSAPGPQAVLIAKAPDGTEVRVKPDGGCG